MSNNPSNLDQFNQYTGKDLVITKNCASLPITHTNILSPALNTHLLDV